MVELPLDDFRHAIRQTYGSESQLVGRERVDESLEGKSVWQGDVLVFDLLDHPFATRCYAWEANGQVMVVLHVGPVDSPRKAVRASILAEGDAGNA